MNSAKRTTFEPIETGFVIDPRHPVLGLSMEVTNASCAAKHAHPRGQLLYSTAGVTEILTPAGSWLLPAAQAAWLPPWLEHEVNFPSHTLLYTLFVDPSSVEGMPPRCCVLEVRPLLRELILRTALTAPDYACPSPEWNLVQTTLDEVRRAREIPLGLPVAQDPRLKRLTSALFDAPGDPRTLAQWAAGSGACGRTLARLFLKEFGMTFAEWRTQLRLNTAIRMLSGGASVTATALDLGYESVSAFIAVFRSRMGVTPAVFSRHLRQPLCGDKPLKNKLAFARGRHRFFPSNPNLSP